MLMLNCTGCGKRLKVADNAGGKRLKCSTCGEFTRVPEDPAKTVALDDEFDLCDLDSFDVPAAPTPRRKAKSAAKPKAKRKRVVVTDADIRLLKIFRPIAASMGGVALGLGALTVVAFVIPRDKPYSDPEAEARLVRFALIYGFSVAALGLASVLKQGWSLILLSLVATFQTFVNIVRLHFGLAAFAGGLSVVGWIGSLVAVFLYIRRVPTTTKP